MNPRLLIAAASAAAGLSAGLAPVQAATPVAGPHAAKAPRNYLVNTVSEEAVAAFFEVPVGALVTNEAFERQLLAAGVLPEDAAKHSYRSVLTPDDVRGANVNAELSAYSLEYFGIAGLSPAQVERRVRNQGGYTTKQYLAYARVGFGPGRCAAARVGTADCPVTVGDMQMSVFKNLDWIENIRYIGDFVKWNGTFSLNREDIASRLVFDLIARKFAGLPHNPLRDIMIDATDPESRNCRRLSDMFRNGAAFEAWLNRIPGMPPSIAHTGGHGSDGVTEDAVNLVTGKLETYHYGIFNFHEGLNCSRIDAEGCWLGEPLLSQYLVVERGVTHPREDGQYAWSCSEIATVFDVIASNPYANPYRVLGTPTTFQFNPDTYPLRDSPTRLTAEDILLFMLAESNALPNMPDVLQGTTKTSVADTEAMFDAGLLNPEFEFQYFVLPTIYAQFLR